MFFISIFFSENDDALKTNKKRIWIIFVCQINNMQGIRFSLFHASYDNRFFSTKKRVSFTIIVNTLVLIYWEEPRNSRKIPRIQQAHTLVRAHFEIA